MHEKKREIGLYETNLSFSILEKMKQLLVTYWYVFEHNRSILINILRNTIQMILSYASN